MTDFGDLIAQPGERHLIYGGTRAGKSSFIDWQIRHIQATRPDCMQILLDTKPRFRAEMERGWLGPKADAPPHGGTRIGARVRSCRIPLSLTSTPNIRFVGFGRDREKLPFCSPEIPTIGDGCSFSVLRSCERKLGTESVIFMRMKCLTSTDGRHTAS